VVSTSLAAIGPNVRLSEVPPCVTRNEQVDQIIPSHTLPRTTEAEIRWISASWRVGTVVRTSFMDAQADAKHQRAHQNVTVRREEGSAFLGAEAFPNRFENR